MKKHVEKRPWGNFEQYVKNKPCTVKILTILPKQSLSLQSHEKREEFWKIIKGSPIVVVGTKKAKAKEGDEFFVPRGKIHRIEVKTRNAGAKILEIAFGKFSEKDEKRIEDKYKRK